MLFLQEGQVTSAKGPGEPFRRGVEWEGWGILRVNSLQGVRVCRAVRLVPCLLGREDTGDIPGEP